MLDRQDKKIIDAANQQCCTSFSQGDMAVVLLLPSCDLTRASLDTRKLMLESRASLGSETFGMQTLLERSHELLNPVLFLPVRLGL